MNARADGGVSRPPNPDPERAKRVEGPLDQSCSLVATHHVYIVTNKIHTVLYIGMTGFLAGRVYQHREKLIEGFTKRYNASKLVYFESFSDREAAENREKQLKGWRREKKIALIEKMNPHWHDLFRPMELDPDFDPLLAGQNPPSGYSRDPSAALRSAQDGGEKGNLPSGYSRDPSAALRSAQDGGEKGNLPSGYSRDPSAALRSAQDGGEKGNLPSNYSRDPSAARAEARFAQDLDL